MGLQPRQFFHGLPEFAKFLIYTFAMLFPLALVAVLVTGDWLLPVDLAFFMFLFFARMLFFMAFVFGPVIAIFVVVYVGFKLVEEKKATKKKIGENGSTESSAQS